MRWTASAFAPSTQCSPPCWPPLGRPEGWFDGSRERGVSRVRVPHLEQQSGNPLVWRDTKLLDFWTNRQLISSIQTPGSSNEVRTPTDRPCGRIDRPAFYHGGRGNRISFRPSADGLARFRASRRHLRGGGGRLLGELRLPHLLQGATSRTSSASRAKMGTEH